MPKVNKAPNPNEQKNRTTQYDYVLDWMRESQEARRSQNALVERSVQAYQGDPSQNYYKKTIDAYATAVYKTDPIEGKRLQEYVKDIPEKRNFVVNNAVETIVSMAMGGIGQYEFGPYDPYMQRDDTLMDKLGSAAKSFYMREKVDSIVPQYIRNAVLCGAGWLHLKQTSKGKKCVTLLDTSQMITDPKRFKTNYERYIGHSQRESFKDIKSKVIKSGAGYQLKTLNEAQVYVDQVVSELNNVLTTDATQTYLHDELRKDLDIFYKPLLDRIKENKKSDPTYMYNGDEVEIARIYDKMNNMYFEVVNRKYIIVAKPHDLETTIKYEYTDTEGEKKTMDKKVVLDDPYVELPYMQTFWDRYAVSPLFYVLDDFDSLCAMESVLYHNLSIMAPITFIGQHSDTEKISRITSVAGEAVGGMMQTFGVLAKTHDITPVMTAITRYEERIKRILKAVDPFELQAMIGDRATAKEVTSATGSVSQGLNPFIANIEAAMSTLGDKFFKLEIIFGEKDTYSFVHNGQYTEVSKQEMAAECEVRAKLMTSIKLEREANARRALELIQYLNGNEAVDKKNFLGRMIPISVNGLVTREEASSMVLPTYRPLPEEVIAAAERKAAKEAEMDEIDKLDLSGYDEATLDQMIAQMSGAPVQDGQMDMFGGGAGLDMSGIDPNTGLPIQDGLSIPPAGDAAAAGIPQDAIPASPELAGEVANDVVV